MRMTRNLMVLSSVLVAAACGRQDVPPPDKLTDLAWMDTLTFPTTPHVASPVELGLVEAEPAAEAPAAAAPAPRPAPRPAAQRTSAPRQTTVSRPPSQGTYTPAPAPVPTRTESNAKRDAAIGAGAGAVIGATVAGSGNRARGAIIGGAAGAVIGGVIGHRNRREVPIHP